MNEPTTQVRVNFGKPFPVFPLDGVVLLPHAMLRLFIFEPRYRQMVEDVLDSTGQIAMATYAAGAWPDESDGPPPIRSAVCIGQIAQHERLADGTYRIWLQGICRARVVQELPADGERLYRAAQLEPIGPVQPDEDDLDDVRARLMSLLTTEPLSAVGPVQRLVEQLEEQTGGLDDVPTSVLLEVVSLSVIGGLDRPGTMYRLLAEGDPIGRAGLIERELAALRGLLADVNRQYDPDAPRGVSWN